MKKIVVSDYDGTFYINDDDIAINVIKVNEFMKNNIFVIATGRSYSDFKEAKEMYNIDCSYLVIDHGATIIKDGKIIENYTIDNNIKNDLITYLQINYAEKICAFSSFESNLTLKDTDLTKIHISYNDSQIANAVYQSIIAKFSNSINCFFVTPDKNSIEIITKATDKSGAVKTISELENIDYDHIYVIGDSYNDIEMIKAYKGCTVENAIDEVKQIASKTFSSVSELITDVLNDQ